MILWRLIVTLHVLIIIANGISILVLPLLLPWPVNVPLTIVLWTLFVRFSFLREICPMTKLENVVRTKIGKEKIDGFIQYYFIVPLSKVDVVGIYLWLKDCFKIWKRKL